ncbi:MAG: hypothetical protein HXX81_02585 [Campylobacterales bacterium]|nr:hypothetical protein [Campylobacterales bacterium]
MAGCDIDYLELKSKEIDEKFFEDYLNQRIVNSFLFNFSKIQDKIGAKLFKKVLYVQKEIDSENTNMRDVLNLLEKLEVIESATDWDRVREIRNILSHGYPFSLLERIENIHLAMDGYEIIKKIYLNLKSYIS